MTLPTPTFPTFAYICIPLKTLCFRGFSPFTPTPPYLYLHAPFRHSQGWPGYRNTPFRPGQGRPGRNGTVSRESGFRMTRSKVRPGPRGINPHGAGFRGYATAATPLRSEQDSAEERIKSGLDALRHEYHNEVRSLADDVRAEVKAGRLADSEAVDTYLHETIDGHQWVIYTWRSQMVALVSDNSDAFVDQFGTEGLVKDGAINWAGMAYCALEQDVRESLGDIDELFTEVAAE